MRARILELGKNYGDMKRGVTPSNVIPGDKILVKQHRENKLDTLFKPEPMTVKAKHGNSVILDSNGVEYKWNATHVKMFIEPSCRENIVSSPFAISTVNLLLEVHVDPPTETV